MHHARSLLALAFATLGTTAAHAQIEYSGGTYTQDFNTLPTANPSPFSVAGKGPHALNTAFGITGLDGWFGANPLGSSSATEFRAHDGSLAGNAGRGIISFGTNASTERALGALPTGNQVSSFGLHLTNTTGQTLTSLTIAYTGEQWRYGDKTTPNTLGFTYALFADEQSATIFPADDSVFVPVPALDFTSLIFNELDNINRAIDGNASANRTAVEHTIEGVEWLPGHTLVIRFLVTEETGQDAGIGIDDLSFSATGGAGEPATTFSSWLTSYGLPADTAADADSDRDGLPDLLEYALDTSPVAPESTAPIATATDESGFLTLSFLRARAELTYIVEASSTLSGWDVLVTNPGTVGEVVTATDDTLPNPRRFLRLRVTKTE